MITAAADGSSLNNPGPAGWAWFIDDEHWAADGWELGTNNQGELKAVLDLLRQSAVDADQELRILCDSRYVIDSLTKWLPGWKSRGWRKGDGKPVLNVELIKALDAELAGRKVSFEWVKGHAGHQLNEAADARAHAAATAVQQGLPVDRGPGYRADSHQVDDEGGADPNSADADPPAEPGRLNQACTQPNLDDPGAGSRQFDQGVAASLAEPVRQPSPAGATVDSQADLFS